MCSSDWKIKTAKKFRLCRSKIYRYTAHSPDHGRQHALPELKTKKRNYTAPWQTPIKSPPPPARMTYSRFMEGLKAAQIGLDRKILADIAATDNAAFLGLVTSAQNALKAKSEKAAQAAPKAAPKAAKAESRSRKATPAAA